MTSIQQILDGLSSAWQADLVRQRRPRDPSAPVWQPPNVWASRRRACTRAMALDMLHPEDDDASAPGTLERFAQGEEAEHAVMARLARIGPFFDPPFKVVEQQFRFDVKDRDGTVLISGKMDGRVRFQNDGARIPVEVKSGRTYDGCRSVEDLDRGVWSRAAVDQILAYLLGAGEPWGFVLVRRFSDLPEFIPVVLEEHLSRAEAFLQQARRAVDARHKRAPLPEFTDQVAECRRCPHFGKSCDPPLDYGAGARVIADENLVMLAETRERLEAAHRDYERADLALKEALRGVERGIMGPFSVEGKWQRATHYEVPAEVKEPYKVVDEKGRFTLKIERVG